MGNSGNGMVKAIFLGITLALITLLAYTVTAPVLEPLFMGSVLAVVTFPIYEKILSWTGNRKSLASGITCILVIVVIVVPLFGIVSAITSKAIGYLGAITNSTTPEYHAIQAGIQHVAEWFPRLRPYVDNPELLLPKLGLSNLAHIGNTVFWTAYGGIIDVLIGFVVVIGVLYFSYMDGEGFVEQVKQKSPLDNDHEDRLFREFASMARGLIKGTLIIGLGQGLAGGAILFLVGIAGAWQWTLMMVVLAIIPVMGVYIVMVPLAIMEIVSGDVSSGLVILIASGIIGSVDNIIRPKLVGKDVQMHRGLILLGLFGGILTWGAFGFIEGPIALAVCVKFWDIFVEFNGGHKLRWAKRHAKRIVRARNRPLRHIVMPKRSKSVYLRHLRY